MLAGDALNHGVSARRIVNPTAAVGITSFALTASPSSLVMLTDGMVIGGTPASSPKFGGAPGTLLASTIATPPAAWTTEAFVLNEQVPRSTRTTLPLTALLSPEHAVDGKASAIWTALR